jgi:hypothetical protein
MTRIYGFAISLFIASLDCVGSCDKDGTSTQAVWLSVEGRDIDRWEPVMGEVHRIRLPSGFKLGIRLDPTTDEKYREVLSLSQWRGIDEMVKITLLDMSAPTPVSVSTTWGGVNSKQGFGPHGGANGLPQLRDQIEFWLHKPQCVTMEMLARRK